VWTVSAETRLLMVWAALWSDEAQQSRPSLAQVDCAAAWGIASVTGERKRALFPLFEADALSGVGHHAADG